MNENSQFNGGSRGAGPSAAMGFVLGAVIGAGIALLLAPGTGKETRQRLADAGRRWGGAARSKFDQVRDTANDLKQDAKSALEAGREAFERGQKSRAFDSPSDGNDDRTTVVCPN
jgi:gas vesicle protein